MLTFQDSKFSSCFSVRALKNESVVNLSISDKKKRQVEMESSQLNVNTSLLTYDVLHALENRFWLYERNVFLERQEYAFCFQKIDLANQLFHFSNKQEQRNSWVSKKHQYNSNKFSFLEKKRSKLLKARILYLTKGGFVLFFCGKKFFLKKCKYLRRKISLRSYKLWFLQNFRLYGFLNYFTLKKWELRSRSFSELKENQYYKNGQKYISLLTVQPVNKQLLLVCKKK